ncbi:MAG: Ppx/GppA phosphatase family protein [Planctomycetota bacterium]
MPAPITVAAIDAGSNAIRLVIADSQGPIEYRRLTSERYPVRLGHGVFIGGHAFDEGTLDRAVAAFEHFRLLMDHYGVQAYRAVATSATRESANQDELLARIEASSGIRLEVIDGEDEARLVRISVLAALRGIGNPDVIVDLGGGSLEVSELDGGRVQQSWTLPIGTVRLMEGLDLDGAMSEGQTKKLRALVEAELARLPALNESRDKKHIAVACGGNAERLAKLAGGRRFHGVRSIDTVELGRAVPRILSLDPLERMAAFGVRRDRAEVMGVAAVVFEMLSERLKIDRWIVPGVGVREGLLLEILAHHYVTGVGEGRDQERRAVVLAARRFGRRMRFDVFHADHVTDLALSLFDQLEAMTGLGAEDRYLLELAALLHDIGSIIHPRETQQHSEYLILHGDLPGMRAITRERVGCLIRMSGDPDLVHPFLEGRAEDERHQLRVLAGILRITATLDRDHRQATGKLEVHREGDTLRIHVDWLKPSPLPINRMQKRAELLSKALAKTIEFEWEE